MNCQKKGFLFKYEARQAMKEMNKRLGIEAVRTIYFCDECNAYHLTHMNKNRSKKAGGYFKIISAWKT